MQRGADGYRGMQRVGCRVIGMESLGAEGVDGCREMGVQGCRG